MEQTSHLCLTSAVATVVVVMMYKETVVYKNGTEVKSVNRVFLMISNPSDPAERAKGCTCREYYHTGLPCIHIAWLVDHLGKNIMDYISSWFTV